MTSKSIVAVCCLVVILVSTPGLAQEQPDGGQKTEQEEEKVFNLSTSETAAITTEEDSEEIVKWEPQLEAPKFELGLTLGMMSLDKTLLAHDQIIYKATDEEFFYGDVKLQGKSAFAPILHLNYNLTTWFSLEGKLTIAFSEYEAEITNRRSVSPEGGQVNPNPDVGEFDDEKRSMLSFIGNLNALWYPLATKSGGKGRWQPYVTGGFGRATYNLDSNYTDDPASGTDFNFGGGIRLIADDLVSLRFEIVKHFHDIEFTPAKLFDSYNDGTVQVPVLEFDDVGRYQQVEKYESNSLGGLIWSIGAVASF